MTLHQKLSTIPCEKQTILQKNEYRSNIFLAIELINFNKLILHFNKKTDLLHALYCFAYLRYILY